MVKARAVVARILLQLTLLGIKMLLRNTEKCI
jgi:hypothetical protein